MFERLDDSARQVVETAVDAARRRGEHAVLTQHLLLALSTTDAVTARLLAEATGGADLGRVVGERPPDLQAPDHDRLLATLGIDLAEIRSRAHAVFGDEAVARAARRARPSQEQWIWRRLWCTTPIRRPECDSPLAGQQIAMIGRVKQILDRATRAAAPGLASPSHLLLALVTARGPACELLTGLGVDLDALAEATRTTLRSDGTAHGRAS